MAGEAPKRILVADDEMTFRHGLARALTRAGYEVSEAASGREMLELFRQQPADLVVTDVYMPDTDGVEALIRLQAEFPWAAVIVMSGGGHLDKEGVLDIARRVGARATLEKPFPVADLLKIVAAVLP